MRRAFSIVLLVLAGILFPIGVIGAWAARTVYDSDDVQRARRRPAGSAAVRRELAQRLTEQLVLEWQPAGDRLPARRAARRRGRRRHRHVQVDLPHRHPPHPRRPSSRAPGASSGLDLADSVAIITSTLQLPSDAKPSASGGASLGSEPHRHHDTPREARRLEAEDRVDAVVGIVAARGGGVRRRLRSRWPPTGGERSADGRVDRGRRRRVHRRRAGPGRAVVRRPHVADPQLSDAVSGALPTGHQRPEHVPGFWIMGYGIVIAAAAGAMDVGAAHPGRRLSGGSPAGWSGVGQTTGGTVLIGALALFVGLIFIQEPLGNFELLIILAGLWLSYLGVLRAARPDPPEVVARRERTTAARWRRIVARLARRHPARRGAHRRARAVDGAGGAAGRGGRRREVQRRVDRCATCRSTMAMFPGAHNSMSSSLYPGWLFAEQISTIGDQLDAGRAGAPHRHPLRRAVAARACPARRRRSCSPTAPPSSAATGRATRSTRPSRPAPTALAARAPQAANAPARHLPLPQLLRARRRAVLRRAGRREELPRHASRRGRDPRHPGRHVAGRHRRRHRRRPGSATGPPPS